MARCTTKEEGIAWNTQSLLWVETFSRETLVQLLIWKLPAVSELFLPALQLRAKEAATNISGTELLDERHIHISRHLVVAVHAEDTVHVRGATKDQGEEEPHNDEVGQGETPILQDIFAVLSTQASCIASSDQLSGDN